MDETQLTRTLAEALQGLKAIGKLEQQIAELRKRSTEQIEAISAQLGIETPTLYTFESKRRSTKHDVKACVDYIYSRGKAVHVNELLTKAIGQPLTLRNKNRLTAAIFTNIKKDDADFKKVAPGTFALSESKYPTLSRIDGSVYLGEKEERTTAQ